MNKRRAREILQALVAFTQRASNVVSVNESFADPASGKLILSGKKVKPINLDELNQLYRDLTEQCQICDSPLLFGHCLNDNCLFHGCEQEVRTWEGKHE